MYDIADLYKAEYAIPCAFEIAAAEFLDIGAETRRAMRDRFQDGALLERCVKDIRRLLLPDETDGAQDDIEDDSVIRLWDGGSRTVAGGTSYSEFG